MFYVVLDFKINISFGLWGCLGNLIKEVVI